MTQSSLFKPCMHRHDCRRISDYESAWEKLMHGDDAQELPKLSDPDWHDAIVVRKHCPDCPLHYWMEHGLESNRTVALHGLGDFIDRHRDDFAKK